MTITYSFSDILTVLEACDCPQTPFTRWNNTVDIYYRCMDGLEHLTREFILWDAQIYVADVQARRKQCANERRVAFIFEIEKVGKFALIACFKQTLTGQVEKVDFHSVIPTRKEEAKIRVWHRELSMSAPFSRSSLTFQVPEEDTGINFVHAVFSGVTHNVVRLFVDKARERQRERCVEFLVSWFSEFRIKNNPLYQKVYDVIQILAQYELLMMQRVLLELDHTWHVQDKVLQQTLFATPLGSLTIIINYLPFRTILQILTHRHFASSHLLVELHETRAKKQREIEQWQITQSAGIPAQSWSSWCYEKGTAAMYYVWQHSLAAVGVREISHVGKKVAGTFLVSDRLLQHFCRLASYLMALIPDRVKSSATIIDSYLPQGWLNKLFSSTGLVGGAYLMWYLGLFSNLFSLGFFLLMDAMHKAVDFHWVDLSQARVRGIKDYIPGSYSPTIATCLNLTTWLIVGVYSWQYRQSLVGTMVSKIAVTEFFSQIFDKYVSKEDADAEEQIRSKYIFLMLGETIIETGLLTVAVGSAVIEEFNRLVAEHHVAVTCDTLSFSFNFFEHITDAVQLMCGREDSEGFCAVDAYGIVKCNVTADNLK